MMALPHHFSAMHRDEAAFSTLLSYSDRFYGNKSAAKRLLSLIGLESPADSRDFTFINNLTKGYTLCSKHPGFSPLSQLLACPLVPVPALVTPTWSAALSAQAQVWSQLKSLTRTQLQRLLLALPLACCAMTQASAAAPAKFSGAISAQGTIISAVEVYASAAVLRLKD
jgi:hypothetical protein